MRVLILMALLAVGCFAEEAVQATTCDLVQNPKLYHHKLVEVTSAVSRGFEDFTLSEPSCMYSVWIEYGGKKGARTVYCCPGRTSRTRFTALTVDGIKTTLVDDKMFRRFDDESKKGVQARLVGRFFAKPVGTRTGYGHLGCCSLFVIQQVLDVQLKQIQ
jgi:hypothetical protein